MTPAISNNTQAILLLTAPLIAGRGTSSADLLSPGEYKRLARHLREMQHQPSDLLSSDAADLLRSCEPIVEASRLQRVLGRGFLLSQVIERWQSRAIWAVSRADADYPRRLKTRLREDSPAVVYGCGNISLVESGGLAVVGSRHVDESLIDYTIAVGGLAARAGRTIVSGGAKGIDQAAMRGALEAGGTAVGVLADSLEKTAMNRENRNLIIDGQLLLLSPYDPRAGFNVGNAMQRNKLIYALADATLVVSSDLKKGGTWAGAVQQLEKLHLVPVYVRSTGQASAGLDALREKGAASWPNPSDANAFEEVFKLEVAAPQMETQVDVDLFAYDVTSVTAPQTRQRAGRVKERPNSAADSPSKSPRQSRDGIATSSANLAENLFATVREVIRELLKIPMKETEVAAALEVSSAQARVWLNRLVGERVLEKTRKPVRYVSKANPELFNNV